MHRRFAASLAVAVVVLVVAGVFFVDPAAGVGQAEQSDRSLGLAQIEDVDRTVFEVTVLESGDARWAVEIQQEISSVEADRRDQFDTFADRFVAEETETFENFRLRAERLTRTGTNLTGREMAATDFRRDAYYDESTQRGIVEMSFRWQGFAAVGDGRVTVSDVFGGGFAILEQQRLRIRHGDGLRFESIDPEPDRLATETNLTGSEWVRWEGPVEFTTERPRAVLTQPAPDGPTEQPDTDDTTVSPDDESPRESDMMLPIFVAVILLVGIGGGAIWYVSTRSQPEPPAAATPETEPKVAGSEEVPVSEAELLSDEDRVLKLLEENGGRMRQVSIVEATEWSKSKVSMLLSDMEDEGEISKLRVGRENIISLAGEEPEAAGSPFEESDRE